MSENKGGGLFDSFKRKGKNLEAEMSFFEHLEVLRWHLIRSAIAIVIFTSLAFTYYDFIFDKIILGPKSPSFWTYRMMCQLAERFHLPDGYCIREINFNIINTQMAGQFTLQINSSLLAGVIMGFPYLLFEVWRFIKPGLTDREKSSASGFVFYSSFLFLLGILFGYFIIAPLSITFLANYRVSDVILNQITIDSYLSSVATLTLGAGIVFELPIVVYILSRLGLLTPRFMRSTRRYAIVVILIIAAIITPTPDILTMLTVAFPLFLLYEVSIIISARIERKRNKSLMHTPRNF